MSRPQRRSGVAILEDRVPIVVLDHPEDVAALPEATVRPSSRPITHGGPHAQPSPASSPAPTTSIARTTPTTAAGRGRTPRAGARPLSAPASGDQPADDAQHRTVLGRITALAGLDLSALQTEWRRLYGTESPESWRSEMLRRRLAYRIQELAYGGLSEATRERLRLIDAAARAKPAPRRDGIPVVGTLLVREFKGVRHEVTVLADGFSYQGKPWKSLSAIAKSIAGGHRDGPLFFGLRVRHRAGGPI